LKLSRDISNDPACHHNALRSLRHAGLDADRHGVAERVEDEKKEDMGMKNLTIIVLSISVIVSSIVMRDQYNRANQNEKTAVHFSVLATKSALLTTAWSQYHLNEISFDSLRIAQDCYGVQLKEINEYWETIN